MQDRKHIEFMISLKTKYQNLVQEREEAARSGYIIFDDGQKMPYISDISQYSATRRWKKLRKQYEVEIKSLKEKLESF